MHYLHGQILYYNHHIVTYKITTHNYKNYMLFVRVVSFHLLSIMLFQIFLNKKITSLYKLIILSMSL